MKNLYSLLIICSITFSAAAQKVNSDFFPYSDAVEFNLKRFTNAKTTNTGNDNAGTLHVAPKGETFKDGIFEFRNNTKEDQVINFGDFFIVDSKNQKHYAKFVVQAMKMTTNNEKLEHTLKAGKTKTFMVSFWPPFPKNEFPKLMVKDQIVPLPEPKE